jgi:hypothetical protein
LSGLFAPTVLVFTHLVLLPALLSFVGVSPRAAERSLKREQAGDLTGAWAFPARVTQRTLALVALSSKIEVATWVFNPTKFQTRGSAHGSASAGANCSDLNQLISGHVLNDTDRQHVRCPHGSRCAHS